MNFKTFLRLVNHELPIKLRNCLSSLDSVVYRVVETSRTIYLTANVVYSEVLRNWGNVTRFLICNLNSHNYKSYDFSFFCVGYHPTLQNMTKWCLLMHRVFIWLLTLSSISHLHRHQCFTLHLKQLQHFLHMARDLTTAFKSVSSPTPHKCTCTSICIFIYIASCTWINHLHLYTCSYITSLSYTFYIFHPKNWLKSCNSVVYLPFEWPLSQ